MKPASASEQLAETFSYRLLYSITGFILDRILGAAGGFIRNLTGEATIIRLLAAGRLGADLSRLRRNL